MSMNDDKAAYSSLPAFTMPELLVYMVIAGIIFLMVMEGFGLFRRYAENRADRIVSNMEFYDGYHRLASVCHAADSIASDDYGRIGLFSAGDPGSEIYVERQCLIITRTGRTDTLFTGISGLSHIAKVPNTPGADSLAVVFSGRDAPLRISFSVIRRPEKEAQEQIEETEKEYNYE